MDTLAVDGTRAVTITVTAQVIMAVGMADGAMAIIPMATGGSMAIRVGGGRIRISTRIPMPALIIILRRRSPSSLMSIASRSSSNPTTGIIGRIRKVTTRTSETVRAVGRR